MTLLPGYVWMAGLIATTPPANPPAPSPTPAPSSGTVDKKPVGDQYDLRRGAPTWPGSGVPGGQPAPTTPAPNGPVVNPNPNGPPSPRPLWGWNYYDYTYGVYNGTGNGYRYPYSNGYYNGNYSVYRNRSVVVNTPSGPREVILETIGPLRFDCTSCTPAVIGEKSKSGDGSVPAPSTTPGANPPPAVNVPQELINAAQAFVTGKYDQAGKIYEKWLDTHPGDGQVMRAMGLCELLQLRIESGCSIIRKAYERDDELINQPLEIDMFPNGLKGLDRLLDAVRAQGVRTKSADAYLTELALMQAKGKIMPLLRVLDRAEGAGLGADVVKHLRDQLEPARKTPAQPVKK